MTVLFSFVDFYKAFKKFIFLSLKDLGFDDPFCILIRTLYNNPCSLNQVFQLFFKRSWSGLSPYVFTCSQDESDDTTLFVKDESQRPIAVQHTAFYSKSSVLNVNLDKCELLKPVFLSSGYPSSVTGELSWSRDDKVRCRLNCDAVVEEARRKFRRFTDERTEE